MPLVRFVAGVNVNRFLVILFPIIQLYVLILILRDEVTVHPVVLALCPRDADYLDYHVGTLGRRLLALRPAKRRPSLRRRHRRRATLLYHVLLVLVRDHRRLVLAVGHCRRRIPARALVQGRARRHVRALALAEALRAEQRRAALRRRGDDGRIRVLAAGQTGFGDVTAGETVCLLHAVAVQLVQDAGRCRVQSRDYLALQARDVFADTALLQRLSLEMISARVS